MAEVLGLPWKGGDDFSSQPACDNGTDAQGPSAVGIIFIQDSAPAETRC